MALLRGDTLVYQPSVGSLSAETLSAIGKPSVEPLITALKGGSLSVRKKAARTLEQITGQKFGEATAKWQEWWEENKGKFQK